MEKSGCSENSTKQRHLRDVTGNKKSFYNHIDNKRLEGGKCVCSWMEQMDLGTAHPAKAEVSSAALASVSLPVSGVSARPQ